MLEQIKSSAYNTELGRKMPICEHLLWEYISDQPLKDTGIVYAFHPRNNVIHAAVILKLLGAEVVLLLHKYSLRPEEEPLVEEIRKSATVIIPKTETPEELLDCARQALNVLKSKDKIIILDHRGLVTRTAHYEFGDIASKIRSIFITKSAENVVKEIYRTRIPIIPLYESHFKKKENQSTANSVVSTCRKCGIDFKGLRVTIVGYGDVGRLIAKAVKCDATVTVVEIDPVRRLIALEDGFKVVSLTDAIKDSDIIVTATGVDPCTPEGRLRRVIKPEHLSLFSRDRLTTIVNSGSYFEADREALDELARKGLVRISPFKHLDNEVGLRYDVFNGASILLLADGFTINLRLGEGNPVRVMDKVQAVLIEGACHCIRNWNNFHPGLNAFPRKIDKKIAQLVLDDGTEGQGGGGGGD